MAHTTLRDAYRALYEAEHAAVEALEGSYYAQRERYYALLRVESARDWVVLLEPQLTIRNVWTAGVSQDSYNELLRELETMTKLLDNIEDLVAEQQKEAD